MELRERARFGPRFVDQRITRRDGTRVHIQARCSDLRAEPTVDGLVFTLRDVTDQHKLEEEMKHRAFHDALTGLPNRVMLQDRIAQQLASSRRSGVIAGVLFVDLDDFKIVNDTMGHSVGDELLVAAAARLATLVRDSDTAARLGGDEFALLIGNADNPTAVEAAAERVVVAFAEPFALTVGLVTSTVTVGVATTLDSVDTDELLRHADLALYAAKAAGKRQWRRYQPVLSAGPAQAAGAPGGAGGGGDHVRVHARLSADRRARHRAARGFRGTDPLAAPAVGHDAARSVHRPGGGNRPDPRAWRLGAYPRNGRRRAVAQGDSSVGRTWPWIAPGRRRPPDGATCTSA